MRSPLPPLLALAFALPAPAQAQSSARPTWLTPYAREMGLSEVRFVVKPMVLSGHRHLVSPALDLSVSYGNDDLAQCEGTLTPEKPCTLDLPPGMVRVIVHGSIETSWSFTVPARDVKVEIADVDPGGVPLLGLVADVAALDTGIYGAIYARSPKTRATAATLFGVSGALVLISIPLDIREFGSHFRLVASPQPGASPPPPSPPSGDAHVSLLADPATNARGLALSVSF